MWTDPGWWFIHQLAVWISYWSLAAWPPTSCTCGVSTLYSSSFRRTETMVFAKQSKTPISNMPPGLLSPETSPPPFPPIKCGRNKLVPVGGGELNRGFDTWQKTSVRLKFNNKMLVKYWTLITCETKECIPFLERILRQLVTLKTVITQDIREQRNVGIPLSLGYSSNRMHWYWPLEKKWQTSPTRKLYWKQKWWVLP